MDYQVFDSCLDAVFVIDQAKKLVYRNPALASVCDLPLRKFKLGALLSDLLICDDPALLFMPDGSWGLSEATPYKEVGFKTNLGLVGKVQISIQPVLNSIGGAPEHWLIFMRDVGLEERLHSKYRSELDLKEQALKDLRVAHEALEEYSRTLEQKVVSRTAELSNLNRLLDATLNSLGQAFFIFDRSGVCLPVFSKACLDLLETEPPKKGIEEVLKISETGLSQFQKWKEALFEEMLPFEDLAALGEAEVPHSKGKSVSLQYSPLRSESGCLEGVVVIGTDRTREKAALESAASEKRFVERMLKIIKNKSQFLMFCSETLQMISDFSATPSLDRNEALRHLHTIKGGADLFCIEELKLSAHSFEGLMVRDPQGHLKQSSLIGKKLTENLTQFFSTYQDVIGTSMADLRPKLEIPMSQLIRFAKKLSAGDDASRLSVEFEEEFLSEPIERSFGHYRVLLQELALSTGKQLAPLKIDSGGLRVPVGKYNRLFSSLVHGLRNAVDHGIESPEERSLNGKDAEAKIDFCFHKDQGFLEIVLKDDGRGINPEVIRKKLITSKSENLAQINSLSDFEIIQSIFDSGFSTAETVTELSGRGIGADAIQTEARLLGGKAWVESKVGQGTQIKVRVPWLAS